MMGEVNTVVTVSLLMFCGGFFAGIVVGFVSGSDLTQKRCARLAKKIADDHDLAEVKKCLKHRSGERPALKVAK